ncbi:hypothetical protein Pmani_032266 [Petrolisthes manimaculis]|uniref:Uncharacterized protein n=1 Tax=Petrolisthes manimaculis TaxID=1843537 RepID=A0AAE1NU40_9EUCA|nr:hypothetical protein Pmani_032266 [Petrolisthes manimaculis]
MKFNKSKPREDHNKQYLMEAILSRPPQRIMRTMVHLDSGATFLYVSRSCMRRMRRSHPPKRLNICITRKIWHRSHVRIMYAGNDTYDIIFGIRFLKKNYCIIDYEKRTLSMQIKHGHYATILNSTGVQQNRGEDVKLSEPEIPDTPKSN